jgi:hypothetical protein
VTHINCQGCLFSIVKSYLDCCFCSFFIHFRLSIYLIFVNLSTNTLNLSNTHSFS